MDTGDLSTRENPKPKLEALPTNLWANKRRKRTELRDSAAPAAASRHARSPGNPRRSALTRPLARAEGVAMGRWLGPFSSRTRPREMDIEIDGPEVRYMFGPPIDTLMSILTTGTGRVNSLEWVPAIRSHCRPRISGALLARSGRTICLALT